MLRWLGVLYIPIGIGSMAAGVYYLIDTADSTYSYSFAVGIAALGAGLVAEGIGLAMRREGLLKGILMCVGGVGIAAESLAFVSFKEAIPAGLNLSYEDPTSPEWWYAVPFVLIGVMLFILGIVECAASWSDSDRHRHGR